MAMMFLILHLFILFLGYVKVVYGSIDVYPYAYPVRNDSTRDTQIISSKFKRVYVDSSLWIPDYQSTFKPR